NVNDEQPVLKLGGDAVDIDLGGCGAGPELDLALKCADLALADGQLLEEVFVTGSVHDARDGELAALGLPPDANFSLVGAGEGHVHDERGVGLEDVDVGPPVALLVGRTEAGAEEDVEKVGAAAR